MGVCAEGKKFFAALKSVLQAPAFGAAWRDIEKEAVAVKELLRLVCGLCAAYCGICEGHGGIDSWQGVIYPQKYPRKDGLSTAFLSRARTICFRFSLARKGFSDCAGLGCFEIWSGKRDSNPRLSAWEADTLPTELLPRWGRLILSLFQKIKKRRSKGPLRFKCRWRRHPDLNRR